MRWFEVAAVVGVLVAVIAAVAMTYPTADEIATTTAHEVHGQ